MASRCILHIIQPVCEVRESLTLANLEPKGRGVYQWQTPDGR